MTQEEKELKKGEEGDKKAEIFWGRRREREQHLVRVIA